MKSKFSAQKKSSPWLTTGTLVLLASGCSMPTYHKWVYEMESNCTEDGRTVKVIMTHDTDPREEAANIEERSIGTEDAKVISSLRAAENHMEVKFASGSWCRFFLSDEEGECFTTDEAKVRAVCTATRKKIGELQPSHDDAGR